MEKYEELEQLLRQYSFKELSTEDKQVVQRFVHSEEEYESLRHAAQQLEAHFGKSELTPGPHVWRRIKKTWEEDSSYVRSTYWAKTPLPAYVAVLLLIGVGSVCWIGGSRYASINQISVKQTAPQADTVYIATKPDTVVRERVIYVERESQFAPTSPVANTGLQHHPALKGINMKEKEELERLLVSGSR
jgi:hypothetical protein